MQHEMQHEI